ncbi:hypothetical protein C2G38_2165427 [Gigaspora rosea]|uniref:Uncharacterized protein n=1 Tax=Gigaspora rosea TaxID=44941 RepID=A0A397VUK3_9GLOM|nr:hypothetical protein C2G38_2165427 [Gigaspora rosea]
MKRGTKERHVKDEKGPKNKSSEMKRAPTNDDTNGEKKHQQCKRPLANNAKITAPNTTPTTNSTTIQPIKKKWDAKDKVAKKQICKSKRGKSAKAEKKYKKAATQKAKMQEGKNAMT